MQGEVEEKPTKRQPYLGRIIVVIFLLLLMWFIVQQNFVIQIASLAMLIALIAIFPLSITHRYYVTEEKEWQAKPILEMRVLRYCCKTIRHSILLVVIAIIVIFGLSLTILNLIFLDFDYSVVHLCFVFFAIYFVYELCKQTVYLAYRIIRPKQF